MSKIHSENHHPESNGSTEHEDINKVDSNQKSIENEEKTEHKEAGSKSNIFSKKNKKSEEKNALLELEIEKKELNDKYLRLYSEFDNYRKRTAKEKLEFVKTATESVIKDLLPILDDFDRAFANISADDERTKELHNGVNLIHQKLLNTLQKKGLKAIDVKIGSDFDLNFQEAVASIPAPSEELKGKVIDVIEKGYILNDNIIRFSKVVVGL